MDHRDHVKLIEKGIGKNSGGVWADFGSGDGAFTLALREIAGGGVKIFSIDKDAARLDTQKEAFAAMFPQTQIAFIAQDFTKSLNLPQLDGLIAANAIHFHQDQVSTMKILASYLKPGGSFIVVEYNDDTGNMWVPYAFLMRTFKTFAIEAGLKNPKLLSTISSGVLNQIYAAKAIK